MESVKIIEKFPSGIVTPPPSKSLAHRALICAALTDGKSVIRNVGLSEDILATLDGINALGALWQFQNGEVIICGRGENKGNGLAVDCRESGSTLRFLLPVAAALGHNAEFTGKGRLMQRPLDEYKRLFQFSGPERDRLTLTDALKSGSYELCGDISSQYISGLLFALPLLSGDSEIRLATPLESAPYIDMTLSVMRDFGVDIEPSSTGLYRVKGGQKYTPFDYTVEADYSQAAFFLCAAALGQNVTVKGLDLNSLQGDKAILEVLKDAGANITIKEDTVHIKAKQLLAIEIDVRDTPDLVPPLAALCCFCEGTSLIKNAGRLRIKESDRLSALSSGLSALGAKIEECPDGLSITGSPVLRGGRVNARGDHRIAMAIALAAIRCEKPVELIGAESVKKSYPGFWRDFEREAKSR